MKGDLLMSQQGSLSNLNLSGEDSIENAKANYDYSADEDLTKGTGKLELNEDVSQWEVKASEIKLESKIGEGSYGVVYRGVLRGKEVAVKKLYASNLDADSMENFRKEVAIMAKLRHPNVLLFMGACTEPGNLLIVTELMPRGSVYDLLHDTSVSLSFQRKIKMAKEAAQGMNWLHMSNPVFIHRDLKTGNLLVDQNWTVKVSDFGLSLVKSNRDEKGHFGQIGTPLWMAPEVLLNKEYNEKCDLYSFGICLWEILTGEEPFPKIENYEQMLDAVCHKHERPTIPADTPVILSDMITKCWDRDPEKRPSFEIILQTNIFEKTLIEYNIKDEGGRKFWEKVFLKEDTLSWNKFIKGYCAYYKIPAPQIKLPKFKCMNILITDETQATVTMDKFGKMIEWFGPLISGFDLAERMEELLRQPYFHGDLAANDAEKLLKSKNPQTFLVRFSAREPGSFAISTLSKDNKVKHFRVFHKPGLKFLIGKTEVNTLQEIMIKYGNELELKYPCPGSPFEKLFQTSAEQQVSFGYQMPELI